MPKTKQRNKLPFVAAALICEKVLKEDKVATFIRIVDILAVPHDFKPRRGTVVEFNLQLVIFFKSGHARGPHELVINWVSPSGRKTKAADAKLNFDESPPSGGANVQMPARIKWEKHGTYWFEVLLNGSLMTMIPLQIIKAAESSDASKPPKE